MSTTPAPELRQDPLTGHRVLIAPGRATRPMTLAHAEPHHRPPRHRAAENVFCPFCPGSEGDTPSESYAIRDPDSQPNGPGWQLRVVPNKFPAVSPDGDGAYGYHDVVVPCPTHEPNPTKLSDEQFAAMLIATRERFLAMKADRRIAYAQFFMNVGAEAGASLDHAHAQILATDFVPGVLRLEVEGSARAFNAMVQCPFCTLRNVAERIVHAAAAAIVHCPYASRFAYETWVIPARHEAAFERASNAELAAFATILKRTLIALDAVLHEPAYNLVLHSMPFRAQADECYHWHVEIIPRTARAAGYEWGTGAFINTVAPEVAARALREAMAR